MEKKPVSSAIFLIVSINAYTQLNASLVSYEFVAQTEKLKEHLKMSRSETEGALDEVTGRSFKVCTGVLLSRHKTDWCRSTSTSQCSEIMLFREYKSLLGCHCCFEASFVDENIYVSRC